MLVSGLVRGLKRCRVWCSSFQLVVGRAPEPAARGLSPRHQGRTQGASRPAVLHVPAWKGSPDGNRWAAQVALSAIGAADWAGRRRDHESTMWSRIAADAAAGSWLRIASRIFRCSSRVRVANVGEVAPT
jgi:hypothetical protein